MGAPRMASRAPPWSEAGSRGAPRSFATIQAQEEGASEARQKLQMLMQMGFAADAAADMLLHYGGDLHAAAHALRKPAPPPPPAWGGAARSSTDAKAWDDLRLREEERIREEANRVVAQQPWAPPKSGKIQVMTRSSAAGAAGVVAAER